MSQRRPFWQRSGDLKKLITFAAVDLSLMFSRENAGFPPGNRLSGSSSGGLNYVQGETINVRDMMGQVNGTFTIPLKYRW